MAGHVDWRRDPMVRLEKRLYPIVIRLLQRALRDGFVEERLVPDLYTVSEALNAAQARYFDDYEIELPQATIERLSSFARKLSDLAAYLERSQTNPADSEWEDWAVTGLAAEVEDILDLLRASFLEIVLRRQDQASRQSRLAAAEIAQISRQIYFISINASVEASRAGEAGKGFSVIGEQIRALSQDASKAMRRMKSDDAAGRNALASAQAAR